MAFFTPFIVSAIDFKYGYVFASGNFMGLLVVFFFLYESSGLTLENVDLVCIRFERFMNQIMLTLASKMYRDPNCVPWQSGSWYPPGYSSRAEVEAEVRKQREERMAAVSTGVKQDTAVPAATGGNGSPEST